jgi:hypothetical protein
MIEKDWPGDRLGFEMIQVLPAAIACESPPDRDLHDSRVTVTVTVSSFNQQEK